MQHRLRAICCVHVVRDDDDRLPELVVESPQERQDFL
jgi:hypothetical protein